MRTTINLPDPLYGDLKRFAAEEGRTLTDVIHDAVSEVLLRRHQRAARQRVTLPTFKGEGLLPGVDLNDNGALRKSAQDAAKQKNWQKSYEDADSAYTLLSGTSYSKAKLKDVAVLRNKAGDHFSSKLLEDAERLYKQASYNQCIGQVGNVDVRPDILAPPRVARAPGFSRQLDQQRDLNTVSPLPEAFSVDHCWAKNDGLLARSGHPEIARTIEGPQNALLEPLAVADFRRRAQG